MSRFKYFLVILFFMTACAQKEKRAEIAASIPPLPSLKNENLNLRSARASMKFHKKVIGLINFAQADANIKVEVQVESLKPGPYRVHLTAIKSCKNPNLKDHSTKDLSEVIADKNGVVKTNVEFTNMSTNDLVGKTIILHGKNKRFPKAVACGVIDKV